MGPPEGKRWLFDLYVTFQGETFHAGSWSVDDGQEMEEMRREAMAEIGMRIGLADAHGDWGLRMDRVEVDRPARS
jgi:hypothetical protein